MNKKTFDALKKIMAQVEEQVGSELEEEIELVMGWMDEVAKEVDEN